jgi:hypothetical protein
MTARQSVAVIQGGPLDYPTSPPDPGSTALYHARKTAEQLITMGLISQGHVGEATQILAGYGTEMWQDGWRESQQIHTARAAYLLTDPDQVAPFAAFLKEREWAVTYVVPAGDPLVPLLDHADHCASREVR